MVDFVLEQLGKPSAGVKMLHGPVLVLIADAASHGTGHAHHELRETEAVVP
jgi:hypothetical protein